MTFQLSQLVGENVALLSGSFMTDGLTGQKQIIKQQSVMQFMMTFKEIYGFPYTYV